MKKYTVVQNAGLSSRAAEGNSVEELLELRNDHMNHEVVLFELGKHRIEAPSDGVFAIVMTILIFNFKVPEFPALSANPRNQSSELITLAERVGSQLTSKSTLLHGTRRVPNMTGTVTCERSESSLSIPALAMS